jgi:hypothetical protein
MAKRIHGEPQPVNVPADMQAVPPEPCGVKVGDAVVFTNENGVSFDRVVRGFASTPHSGNRFVYLNNQAWWFPVNPSELRAALPA